MDLREFSVTSTRRHPWELARADFFCELLARRVLDHEIARILDVGAGDAFLASKLVAFAGPRTEVVCTDLHYDSAIGARLGARLPANVRLSRELPPSPADLILLLDVLEHIEDDRAFLLRLVRDHLAPGGELLISVPAWPALYGRHDQLLAHHRRYRPGGVRALLLECGLSIRESGGLFHSLVAVRAAQIALERALPRAGGDASGVAHTATAVASWDRGERLSRWLQRAFRLDSALSRALAAHGLQLPGLSWWALCQRSS
jgi:SAM-dependent methyltransferase